MIYDYLDRALEEHQAWQDARIAHCHRCGSDELEYNETICGDCE